MSNTNKVQPANPLDCMQNGPKLLETNLLQTLYISSLMNQWSIPGFTFTLGIQGKEREAITIEGYNFWLKKYIETQHPLNPRLPHLFFRTWLLHCVDSTQANFQSAAFQKLTVKLNRKNSEIKFENCRIYVHRWKLTFKVSSGLNSSDIFNDTSKIFYFKVKLWVILTRCDNRGLKVIAKLHRFFEAATVSYPPRRGRVKFSIKYHRNWE